MLAKKSTAYLLALSECSRLNRGFGLLFSYVTSLLLSRDSSPLSSSVTTSLKLCTGHLPLFTALFSLILFIITN
jgi:hypothetical protein